MLIHDGVVAYEAIFDAISQRIGAEMASSVTGLTRESVDKREPLESIVFLVEPILKMFGEIPTMIMIKEALERCFVGSYANELLSEIKNAVRG